MTVYHNSNRWDASNVLFEGGVIRAYDKSGETPGMQHIDYGLTMLRASALAEFAPTGQAFDLAELLASMVRSGEVMAWEAHQRFYEIGSASGLHELRRLFERVSTASSTSSTSHMNGRL